MMLVLFINKCIQLVFVLEDTTKRLQKHIEDHNFKYKFYIDLIYILPYYFHAKHCTMESKLPNKNSNVYKSLIKGGPLCNLEVSLKKKTLQFRINITMNLQVESGPKVKSGGTNTGNS